MRASAVRRDAVVVRLDLADEGGRVRDEGGSCHPADLAECVEVGQCGGRLLRAVQLHHQVDERHGDEPCDVDRAHRQHVVDVLEQQAPRPVGITPGQHCLDLCRAGHGVGARRNLDVRRLEEARSSLVDVAAQLEAVAEEPEAEVVQRRRPLGHVALDPGPEAGDRVVELARGHQARADRVHLHQVRRVVVPALPEPRHRRGSGLEDGRAVLIEIPAARLYQRVLGVAVPLDQRLERRPVARLHVAVQRPREPERDVAVLDRGGREDSLGPDADLAAASPADLCDHRADEGPPHGARHRR